MQLDCRLMSFMCLQERIKLFVLPSLAENLDKIYI